MTLALELLASLFTLMTMAIGTGSLPGCFAYLVSLVFWFWLMIRMRLWGLLPLNVAGVVICLHHIAVAVQ